MHYQTAQRIEEFEEILRHKIKKPAFTEPIYLNGLIHPIPRKQAFAAF